MTASIRARGTGIRFLTDRQRRPVSPAVARVRWRVSEHWGLRGVDVSIGPGEGVALIGPSGAGKTTLLRTIAGVLEPDVGLMEVEGRVGSLLSTGAGLLGLLTGRENCMLLGVLAGLSRRRSRVALDEVRVRVGIGDAFERQVSSYSHGMRARLGFAVAEETNPRILLLDEVLEALDHEFRAVLEQRARAILSAGGIVVAAGHDHPLLERLCDRAVLMDRGGVRADGEFAAVRETYLGARAR